MLQVWKSFEEQRGTADDVAKVEGMMPVQGKRRYVDEETGQLVEGMFPYVLCYEKKINYSCADYDYIFADDEREANPTSYKFLQMAHAWAAAKKVGGAGGGPAQSRFTAALVKDDHDTDDRAESDDGGASEPMDEDVASVASSHEDS
jgi:crooked neck